MAKPTLATVAVLLSAGLLDFARGSLSFRGDKVFSDFDFKVVRGKFDHIRAQRTFKHKDLPSPSARTTTATATTTTTAGLPGGGNIHHDDVPGLVDLTLLSKVVKASATKSRNLQKVVETSAINARSLQELVRASAVNSRNLQESDCSDGTTSVLVSSTVFPLMEGCFQADNSDGTTSYATGTALIVPFEPTTTADLPVWLAYYQVSTSDFTLTCFSAESSDEVDPSEATWYCDNDGDGSEFTLADDEFSVSCGCSVASPSPAVSPAPVPSTTVPTCDEGDTFSIASKTLPDAEGCYLDTAAVSNDKAIYSVSGTSESGQILMVAMDLMADDPSAGPTIAWLLAYVAPTDGSEDDDVFCVSIAPAEPDHPSEVEEWLCDEGVFIDVVCGCSSSPSPETPSPAPSLETDDDPQSNSSICPGDKSFTIAANAAPELSGCFIGVTTSDGLFLYTVSGTTTQSEVVVVDLANDDGDFNWYIGYVSLSNSEDTTTYCVSAELSTDVNPGDASWICDFTGDAESFVTATEDEISIVCGSCGTAVGPTPQPAVPLAPSGTPTPVAGTPTAQATDDDEPEPIADNCPGDGSFTIKANAQPDLDGCFEGSWTSDGIFVYTVTATTSFSEVVAFSLYDDDDGDFKWYLGFISLDDDDSEETRLFCYSEEPASDVTPEEASWICDFTGDANNFGTTTDQDILVTCVSTCTRAVPKEENDEDNSAGTAASSSARKLGIGFVAAGGAGMVALASAYGGWC